MLTLVRGMGQMPFRIYTVEDGLISNSPQGIAQDHDGYIWIGTNEGMSIYDGNKFLNFTSENHGLSKNAVRSFFEYDQQDMWVVNSESIDVFRKRQLLKSLPLPGLNFIMRSRDGSIYACGEKGIYQITGESMKLITPLREPIFNFFEIGNIFVGNQYWNGPIILDHFFHIIRSFTIYGIICRDHYNYWWAGREINLIDTAAIMKGDFKFIPLPSALSKFQNKLLTYPFMDSEGFTWISESDNGIIRIDRSGGFVRYNQENGLNTNWTTGFFEDAEGNIWVPGNGFIKFFNKALDKYSFHHANKVENVYSFTLDPSNDVVWISLPNVLSCIKDGQTYFFRLPVYVSKSPPGSSGGHIFLHKNSIWIDYFGLWMAKIWYDPKPRLKWIKHWSKFRSTPLSDITQFREAPGGGIFLNFNHTGLFEIGKDYVLRPIALGNRFFKFFVDGDQIWSTDRDLGIVRWRFSGEKGKSELAIEKNYSEFTSKFITGIEMDREGRLLVGTRQHGLFMIIPAHKPESDSYIIKNITSDKGLPSNEVRQIIVNSGIGKVLIGCSRGLSVLKQQHDSICAEPIDKKLGTFEIINNGLLQDHVGNLWFASQIALFRLRTDFKPKLIHPKVFITRILSATNKYSYDVNSGSGNIFSYKENDFTFEFSSTSYRNEDLVKYSYRISKGNDSGVWSFPLSKHNVSFSSLAPGNYLFNVKAESADELWSETFAQYQFRITPPFWKTSWFDALVILFFIGIGYALLRFRLTQLTKTFKIRSKISRDLHDEIGSTLSGVNLYSEWAKSQIQENKIESASTSLEKIIATSGDMLRKMNDIVWAINPQYDSFEQLFLRLKAFATVNAAPKGIVPHFEMDNALQLRKMDLNRRENIYFVCREAIHNAIKYSGASNLYFKLGQAGKWIIIDIRDDGAGFDFKNVWASKNYQGGNGLRNMQTRAMEMKGKINIDSTKDTGTAIRLEVPFT